MTTGEKHIEDFNILRDVVFSEIDYAISRRDPSKRQRFRDAYNKALSRDESWWTKRSNFTISQWLEEFGIALESKAGLQRARQATHQGVDKYYQRRKWRG